jgi:hypothetical protein
VICSRLFQLLSIAILTSFPPGLLAGVGDPQVRTDHPWYPGELACSTFERLFDTQAEVFERVTGRTPQSDEDRALAAWMWRNLHYAHGEAGCENLSGEGFLSGDNTTREYWTGMFAHGFGLCGTTHAQWTAELNALLGHGRSRTVGVVGHNSCEVFLKGGLYGDGRWVLLDHDISTVIFDSSGSRLLSIEEIARDLQFADPSFAPERQHGWPLGGLHPDDPQALAEFNVVEHLPGYAGPPPMVHLRAGESLRRYFHPGLDDGRTFVFWGRNYGTGGVPGPERSRTWINQPERFVNSPDGTGYREGQARFGNAVFVYRPNFADGSYREGVIAESETQIVFEFQSPYIIAATPPNESAWGVYDSGCSNGLVIRGTADVAVEVSVDRGGSWLAGGQLSGELDLTDHVKGHRQYWLRFHCDAGKLANAGLEIVTVCQANPATFPRLSDDGSVVRFAASGEALVSAGPNRAQAEPHVIAGAFDTPQVTLELAAPREATATRLYTAAHVASGNPPDPEVRYQIEYSVDAGNTWSPVVSDWKILRQGNEPDDFWSQSFCYGDCPLPEGVAGPVQVRFHNDGGKRYLRAEAHLAYRVANNDECQVTFAWSDDEGDHLEEHTFEHGAGSWPIDTGSAVEMQWVEFSSAP